MQRELKTTIKNNNNKLNIEALYLSLAQEDLKRVRSEEKGEEN